MRILIVSSNPLFSEAMREATSAISPERFELEPDLALQRICEVHPDIIMVDETIPALLLEGILSEARLLPRTRTIVVNPIQNEIILLDSRRAILKHRKDLTEAILAQDLSSQQQNDEYKQNAEEARALSGMFNFLAAMFNERPDIDLVRRLRTIGVNAFVNLQQEGDSGDISQGIQLISSFMESTADLPEEEVERDLAVDWTRLFRGVSPNYGPPPPYESLYLEGGTDEVKLFLALNSAYRDAGVEVEKQFGNRLDYIGLELAFLSHLAEQEAFAWEKGKEDIARDFSHQADRFFSDHPGAWATSFFTTALQHARTDFFKGYVQLSRGIINQFGGFKSF